MRNLFSIIIVLLWLMLGYLYHQWSHSCCASDAEAIGSVAADSTTVEEAPSLPPAYTGPLAFRWNQAEPVLSADWASHKAALKDGLEDGKLLEIAGWYRANEVNNTDYENLGLARAAKIRALFPDIPDNRIRTMGRLVDGEIDTTLTFEGSAISYKINNENIVEVADVTRIYFPFNSTRKLQSATVEAYLNDVAERVKRTGENIQLTGHTDNIGDPASNLTLGQDRADIIRDYLIGIGVDAAKISAESKGETAPIGDNATAAGRAENRRTELKIVK